MMQAGKFNTGRNYRKYCLAALLKYCISYCLDKKAAALIVIWILWRTIMAFANASCFPECIIYIYSVFNVALHMLE